MADRKWAFWRAADAGTTTATAIVICSAPSWLAARERAVRELACIGVEIAPQDLASEPRN